MTTVAFRFDAGALIGLGHASRCMALAAELLRRGANILAICAELPAYLEAEFRQLGCGLLKLDSPAGETDDAMQTLRVLQSVGTATWVCVDHYRLSCEWERTVASGGSRIAAIDDYGERRHCCSLLIDHNAGSESARYDGLVPNDATRLVGADYALLPQKFANRSGKRIRSSVARLHIAFGGSDATLATETAIGAIADLGWRPEVDIVVGSTSPRFDAVRAAAASLAGATVHVDTKQMDELLNAADLAIGAAGVSALERCAMALPSVLIVVADNQKPIARALERAGAALLLGDHREVTSADVTRAVRGLVANAGRVEEMSRRALAVCDGNGASRVAARMLQFPSL